MMGLLQGACQLWLVLHELSGQKAKSPGIRGFCVFEGIIFRFEGQALNDGAVLDCGSSRLRAVHAPHPGARTSSLLGGGLSLLRFRPRRHRPPSSPTP
ncbi:hypothetical protein DMX09_11595 [Pseudomonas protegens]|nr:hypothetical protein DMX09_11595 [Pseudomonas protegens]